MRLVSALHAAFRLLAPHCVLCGFERGDPVCDGCHADFLGEATLRCPRCALPIPGSQPAECGRCRREPPRFDATVTLADYAPPIDAMVKALKYGHQMELGRAFGVLLAHRTRQQASALGIRAILPVPLAFERHAERGFNQALEIARAAAAALQMPLESGLLIRARHTPPQESLDLPARRRNVRDAFAVPTTELPRVRGRAIALVDDVMTSGSTLDAAAAALREAGAARIVAWVVARTP